MAKQAKKSSDSKTVTVTLVKSPIGFQKVQGKVVESMGLRRLNHSVTLKDTPETQKVLEQLKVFMDDNPRVSKLRIEGHTDNVGTPDGNVTLSGQRALTVKAFVVGKGVAKERLIAVGCGQNKPIADNTTEEGKAKNRRTEFRIAELNGKKYMGRDPNGGCKPFE